MINKSKILTSVLILTLAFGLNTFSRAQNITIDPIKTISAVNAATKTKQPVTTTPQTGKVYTYALPLAMVASPSSYLGKNVKFKAKFDKFATLGLDYKPAYRSSENT